MGPDLALQQEERFGDDGIGVEVTGGLVLLGFLGFIAAIGYQAFSAVEVFLS